MKNIKQNRFFVSVSENDIDKLVEIKDFLTKHSGTTLMQGILEFIIQEARKQEKATFENLVWMSEERYHIWSLRNARRFNLGDTVYHVCGYDVLKAQVIGVEIKNWDGNREYFYNLLLDKLHFQRQIGYINCNTIFYTKEEAIKKLKSAVKESYRNSLRNLIDNLEKS